MSSAVPRKFQTASPLKKIVWALDAFPDDDVTSAEAVRTLRTLTAKGGTVIEPTYVMNPDQMLLTLQEAWTPGRQPRTNVELEDLARRALSDTLKDSALTGLSEPTILTQKDPALNHSVRTLIQYAERTEADLIVINTHARRGLRRVLLGSFAETVLLHSRVPVLVINPATRAPDRIQKILCPTDFTRASREAFDRAVDLAAALGAEITLYHKIPNPVEPVFQSGVHLLGGNWVPVHTYFDRESQQALEEDDRWIAAAKSKGVHAERIVDDRPGSVSDSVLEATENAGAQLVAMASETGPVASALIGSITRQVVRSAKCLVWVIHPTEKSRNQNKDIGASGRKPRSGELSTRS